MSVIPAKAGIYVIDVVAHTLLDSRFRGNDGIQRIVFVAWFSRSESRESVLVPGSPREPGYLLTIHLLV